MSPIVIIGTGLAGYTLAREIRKRDTATPLHILTRDDGRFYSKPMLSNALAKGKTAADLASATAADMAGQLGATVWADTEVTAIDSQGHTLQTTQGTLTYAKLVLALGAQPIRIPFEGTGGDDVLSVNNLEDYGHFRAAIEGKRHIALIGAGLIGCEFANDLAEAGYAVDVIGLGATPMDTLIPAEAGAALQTALAARGVSWQLGVSAQRIDRQDGSYDLQLTDGAHLQADVVMSAIGLKPAVALAKQAGLTVDRGIVTDAQLMTSARDVYALGDCAQVQGQVLPFVMPIMHGARALAAILTGTPTPVHYPVMPVVIKTPAHPVVVATAGPGGDGHWETTATPEGVRALRRRQDGQLTGFCLTGQVVGEKQRWLKELGQHTPA